MSILNHDKLDNSIGDEVSNPTHKFSIIAVRCNSDSSTGKRKLVANQIYYLLDGYDVKTGKCVVTHDRSVVDSIYDDYLSDLSAKNQYSFPHIQISAIVGQNGSGKSSLVEFIMRLINNLATVAFGELMINSSSERLHYIEGVNGDLWYVVNNVLFQLHVKDNTVKLYRFNDSNNLNLQNTVFSSDKDCNYNNPLYIRASDDTLKFHFEKFFFTIITNYSIYAYNTNDFSEEDDSKNKLELVKKQLNKFDGIKVPSDFFKHNNWLDGLFHKNDGYQIPIVITPQREEGNIDINNESSLCKERLISLLVRNQGFRRINGHLIADGITIKYDNNNTYDLKFFRKKFGFGTNFSKKDYSRIKNLIADSWLSLIDKNWENKQYSKKPFFNLAIGYLTYKTFKIAFTYYRQFYMSEKERKKASGKHIIERINSILKYEQTNFSHITRKIYQTLAYIVGEIYAPSLKELNSEDASFSEGFTLKTINERYNSDNVQKLKFYNIETPEYTLYTQAAIPPPFFNSFINIHEDNQIKTEITFESLSSGEKQLAFSISSILYHLDNLNSIKADNSDDLRIQYKNIFFVLEEIELYFHPELQQGLIKYILDGISQMNLHNIKGIHIFLITHSPYILSDIPSQNILVINSDGYPVDHKDKIIKSFGGNIHDILRHPFFLSDGAVGAFAKEFINHLGVEIGKIDEKTSKTMLNTIKKKIGLIDEPIVYRIFMDEYTRRAGITEVISDIDRQIEELQRKKVQVLANK